VDAKNYPVMTKELRACAQNPYNRQRIARPGKRTAIALCRLSDHFQKLKLPQSIDHILEASNISIGVHHIAQERGPVVDDDKRTARVRTEPQGCDPCTAQDGN
jgi:hypothetical protein